MRVWYLVCLCAALAAPVAARGAETAPPSLELELDGWRLQQFAAPVEEQLGPPFKVVEGAPQTFKAYRLGEEAYLVVGTCAPLVNTICSLQLTGIRADATALRGLRLGDPVEKVRKALGKPAMVKKIDDPDVDLWDYPDRNYSVEVTRDGHLYSVRIETDAQVLGKPKESDPWPAFKADIASGAFDRVEPWLRPDVEVYRDGQTLAIRGRYGPFLETRGDELRDALLGRNASVRSAIAQHEPEMLVRVSENMGVGLMFQFPDDSPLHELVFFPYAGRYRLYEADFRPQGRPFRAGLDAGGAGVAAQ